MKLSDLVVACIALAGLTVLVSVVTTRTSGSGQKLVPDYPASIRERLKPTQVALGHTKGSTTSRYTLYEFADFECPACRLSFQSIQEVVEGAKGKLSFTFFHLPLARHSHAKDAAKAMIAASIQGKTWEAFQALFSMPHLGRGDLLRLSKDLGLDQERFIRDMASNETIKRISSTESLCREYQVRATPTLILIGPDGRGTQVLSATDLQAHLNLG